MGSRRLALILTGVLLALAAFPVRLRYGFGVFRSVSILDLFLVLSPLWLMVANWSRPHRIALGERAFFTVLAMPLMLGILSLAWSQNHGQTLYYITQSTLALAAYLLTVNFLQHLPIRLTMRCLSLFLLVSVATAFLALLRIPGFGPDTFGIAEGSAEHLQFLAAYYSRLSHPYWGVSNALAGVLVFFAPLMLGWAIYARQRRYFLVAGVLLVAILLTLSRGGLLALIVGLLACTFFWVRGVRVAIGVCTATFGCVALALWGLAQTSPLLREHLTYRLLSFTYDIRLTQFSLALQHIMEAPLLGYGAGVVPRGEILLAGGVHNAYLQFMMGLGLPLGLFVSLLFYLLAGGLLLRKGPFAGADPVLAVAIGGSLLAELTIFISAPQFEGVILRTLFYIGMGFASTLLRTVPARDSHAA